MPTQEVPSYDHGDVQEPRRLPPALRNLRNYNNPGMKETVAEQPTY